MLWEYGPNICSRDTTTMMQALYAYPNDYCKLFTFYWYSGCNYEIENTDIYNDLVSTGKVVSLAEWRPDGAILTKEGEKQSDKFTAADLLTLIERMRTDG